MSKEIEQSKVKYDREEIKDLLIKDIIEVRQTLNDIENDNTKIGIPFALYSYVDVLKHRLVLEWTIKSLSGGNGDGIDFSTFARQLKMLEGLENE